MTDFTVSEFLLHCAECIAAGWVVDRSRAPTGWSEYVSLTLPVDSERWDGYAIVETRVLRFMLAAAIAKSEGR